MRCTHFLAMITVCLCLGWEDWPGFAGPNGDNVSNEKGLITSIPKQGLKVLWRLDLNPGYGAPIVSENKVFLLDRVINKSNVLRCLDLETGKEEWSFSYEAPGQYSYPGSRSQPAADKKHVYIMDSHGTLICVGKKSHKPVWKHNVIKEFSSSVPHWGVSQSPTLYKDMVVVAPVGKAGGVTAFKRDTGKLAYKSKPLPGALTYVTCMVSSIHGKDQVMTITTKGTFGLDARTGELLWDHLDWTCRIPIASPVHLGKGRVFVTGGYGAGACLFEVKKRGKKFKTSTVFKTKKCNGQIHQPIFFKNHLFLNGNDKGKRDGMVCLDLKGRVRWKTEKDPGFDWGGLLLADNMIYAVDGTKGDLCFIKPDSGKYKEVGRFNLLKGDKIWSSIVLSSGRLLLRDQTCLKCVDLRKIK